VGSRNKVIYLTSLIQLEYRMSSGLRIAIGVQTGPDLIHLIQLECLFIFNFSNTVRMKIMFSSGRECRSGGG